jgi:hypothetical protein
VNTLEAQVAEEQAEYENAAEGEPQVEPKRVIETEEPESAEPLPESSPQPEGEEQVAPAGQDPEAGKLFDVPRVKIVVDKADPSVLKVAFSGQIELERGVASEVDFYNRLRAGKGADLQVHVHVAGAKRTHRRDSEGNVDAVLETKSLIVTDVSLV